jgi:putative alpha-1,2-mannosidase
VAISTVSIESAWKNMEAETSGKSFDEIKLSQQTNGMNT